MAGLKYLNTVVKEMMVKNDVLGVRSLQKSASSFNEALLKSKGNLSIAELEEIRQVLCLVRVAVSEAYNTALDKRCEKQSEVPIAAA